MKLNRIEKALINNPIRSTVQQLYEGPFRTVGGRAEGACALDERLRLGHSGARPTGRAEISSRSWLMRRRSSGKRPLSRATTPPSGGGQFENQERALARLAIVVSLSVLTIFFLLYSKFNSVKQGLLVLAILLTIGGISALWGRGLHLSVSAAIGFHRAVRHCRALS